MAKEIKIKQEISNDLSASQEFNVLRTSIQMHDKYFVPVKEMLLVLGNVVESEDGSRSVGQHFPVVKIIDGTPREVIELYVGQLVKQDVSRVLAFPNELSDALRQSSTAFKDVICGKILEVTNTKEILDRVWDKDHWKRNDDGTFASRKNNAYEFTPKKAAFSDAVMSDIYNMLEAYYIEKYPDLIEVK